MDSYKEKVYRKWCSKCKGSGFVLKKDSNGYEFAVACECEEGKQRIRALSKKEGENDG